MVYTVGNIVESVCVQEEEEKVIITCKQICAPFVKEWKICYQTCDQNKMIING